MTSTERALESYLQWLAVEKGRSRATLEAYRRDLTRLLDWSAERDEAAVDLSEPALEAYCNQLRRDGLAESSVSRSIASLRGSGRPRRL